MSNRLEAIHELIKSLKTDYPSKRVFNIHPSLEFVNISNERGSNGNGITARVNTDVTKGTILLTVPLSSRFSIANMENITLIPSSSSSSSKNKSKIRLRELLLDKIEKKMPDTQYINPVNLPTMLLVMYVMSLKYKQEVKKEYDNTSNAKWIGQIDTWPSLEELQNSLPFFWDIQSIENIVGTKNQVYTMIDEFQREIKMIFDKVVKPTLSKCGVIEYFISPLVTGTNVVEGDINGGDFISQVLWNNFQYAASITFSRSHGGYDSRSEIIPLVELFNGLPTSCATAGTGTDAKGKEDINIDFISLPLENRSEITAMRNIKKGEYVYIDYGDFVAPSAFLLKYGMIPQQLITRHDLDDRILIYLPPDLLPSKNDVTRINALKRSEFHSTKYECETDPIQIRDGIYESYISGGHEPLDICCIRHFILVSKMLDDEAVRLNLETGRIKANNINSFELANYFDQIIDYNIQNMPGNSSEEDMQLANDPATSALESSLLLARIAQREVLWKWRHAFRKKYDVPNFDIGNCCTVCGRSYPLLKCSQCKIECYCSREHQKSDWKVHKRLCRK